MIPSGRPRPGASSELAAGAERAAGRGARRSRSAARRSESTAEERGHEGVARQPLAQQRVRLAQRRRPGRSQSQLRASMKKRAIALSAAVSTPLPATSPISTRDLAAWQLPRPVDVASGRLVVGRLVEQRRAPTRAARAATSGTKPRVSARAIRRSRSKSTALAMTGGRDAREPREQVDARRRRTAGPSVATTDSTPNRRGPSTIGTCSAGVGARAVAARARDPDAVARRERPRAHRWRAGLRDGPSRCEPGCTRLEPRLVGARRSRRGRRPGARPRRARASRRRLRGALEQQLLTRRLASVGEQLRSARAPARRGPRVPRRSPGPAPQRRGPGRARRRSTRQACARGRCAPDRRSRTRAGTPPRSGGRLDPELELELRAQPGRPPPSPRCGEGSSGRPRSIATSDEPGQRRGRTGG